MIQCLVRFRSLVQAMERVCFRRGNPRRKPLAFGTLRNSPGSVNRTKLMEGSLRRPFSVSGLFAFDDDARADAPAAGSVPYVALKLLSPHAGLDPASSRRESARREGGLSAQGLGLAGYRLEAGMTENWESGGSSTVNYGHVPYFFPNTFHRVGRKRSSAPTATAALSGTSISR